MANSRGNLVAAEIYNVDEAGKRLGDISVRCMFNPFEYTVSKSNSYQEQARNNANVPQAEFSSASPQTLQLSLLFDTYESGQDVTQITNLLWQLMEPHTRTVETQVPKVDPPHVAFEWGVFRFVSYITQMTQRFTLFRHDGTPVRAKVDVTFTKYSDRHPLPPQNPTSGGGPDERIWLVTEGDRLDLIAAAVYGDARRWRLIAERNQLWNPEKLRNGQHIAIPIV